MHVVMLSKALVSGAYQKKLEELARLPDITLTAIVPPSWREPKVGTLHLERRFTAGYTLYVLPLFANGYHHAYVFRGLRALLSRLRPDVLHIDEEAFNPATFFALRAGQAVGARCCFYNWANMARRYPPPFCWFEHYAFRHAHYGIVGNQEAATIVRHHGYRGALAVLPQFGVDPNLFHPKTALHTTTQQPTQPRPFTIGYVGRLITWKGITDIVDALPDLPNHVQLVLVGDGDARALIEQRAIERGVRARLRIQTAVSSTDVPAILHQLDVLVLPSHTQSNWKEQFGRILIEAMSCGVPVIGSSSGEIPNVIGDAGIVVPERNVAALRDAIATLLHDESVRHDMARRGRERVLAHYTQAALARHYYDIYHAMMAL